jgi:hypothetical protein
MNVALFKFFSLVGLGLVQEHFSTMNFSLSNGLFMCVVYAIIIYAVILQPMALWRGRGG